MKHGIAQWARLGLVMALLSIVRFTHGQDNVLSVTPFSITQLENRYVLDGAPVRTTLAGDVEMRHAVAYAEGTEAGTVAEATDSFLVYSNTRGTDIFGPAGSAATARIADDVTITALADCLLDRYVVRVTGDEGDADDAQPFNASAALYWVFSGATGQGTAVADTPGGELGVNAGFSCITDADCNDDNVCTDDACVDGLCVNTPNAAPCDDGLFCTGADACAGGACSLHAGNPCASDSCDEQNDRCLSCPPGSVTFVDPPDGAIDARQPYPPEDSTRRQGIISLTVQGPAGIDDKQCWTLCETRVDGTRNEIKSIVDNGHGTFTVDLIRTISIGAVTTLTYTDDNGTPSRGVFTSHPANVDGDSASGPVDILSIVDIINRMREASWGNLSCDMNHSGVCEPADILRLIDLLNGADAFDPWLGQPLPECGMCCP